jgi:hypothetical protein
MIERCNDIFKAAKVLEDFQSFLGPELIAVTGNSQGIFNLKKKV